MRSVHVHLSHSLAIARARRWNPLAFGSFSSFYQRCNALRTQRLQHVLNDSTVCFRLQSRFIMQESPKKCSFATCFCINALPTLLKTTTEVTRNWSHIDAIRHALICTCWPKTVSLQKKLKNMPRQPTNPIASAHATHLDLWLAASLRTLNQFPKWKTSTRLCIFWAKCNEHRHAISILPQVASTDMTNAAVSAERKREKKRKNRRPENSKWCSD